MSVRTQQNCGEIYLNISLLKCLIPARIKVKCAQDFNTWFANFAGGQLPGSGLWPLFAVAGCRDSELVAGNSLLSGQTIVS